MADDKEKSIGALWENSKSDGSIWMSGSIEIDGKKLSIVAFHNYKKEAKHPDYKIFISRPKGEGKQEKSYPASGNVADVDDRDSLPF